MTFPLSIKRCAILVLGLWLAFAATARAAEWTDYDLPGIEFSVLSNWEITYSQRDVECDFKSPDGTFQLWVRWWYPDEPLLGYDDITFHDRADVAGQQALLIRSEGGGERMLQIAFPDAPNVDGEILLFQLLAPTSLSIANHELMMRALANKLVFNGTPAKLNQKAPFGGDLSKAASATPPTIPSPTPAKGADGFAFHYDRAADISLPHPEGWSVHTAQGNGVNQVALVSPKKDAMVLAITGAPADTDLAMGFLYRDSLVVKSIEAETYPEIAGMSVHAIETIAKVYTINNIAMPYPRGRVWIYRDNDDDRAFILITIRAENAPDAQSDLLARIATGFRYGPPPEQPSPNKSPATPPANNAPVILITPEKSAAAQPAGQEWLDLLNARFGGDCRLLDLATWAHPTRDVIESAKAEIDFAALCKNDVYPVFGVRFPYDPRAATEDYFHPLYGQTYLANGRWDYSFLEVGDALLISLVTSGENALSIELEELPAAEQAQDPALEAPNSSPKDSASAQQVFDGRNLSGWDTLVYYGGDFDIHARLGPDALAVDIPADKGWATVGLVSQTALLAVPDTVEDMAQRLIARIDFDATDHFVMALADPDQVTGEPWSKYDLRLHAFRTKEGLGHFRLERRGQNAVVADGLWPKGVGNLTLSLRPDGVLMLRNPGGTTVLRADIPAELRNKDWFLRAYTRPFGKNRAARLRLLSLALDTITPSQEPDTDQFTPEAIDTTLFDGSGFGSRWQIYEEYDNYFRRHAAIDGALVIARAADTDKVRVGIGSIDPVIWLDRFTGTASARLTFELDGDDATGLDVTLGPRDGYDGTGRTAFHAWFERDPQTASVTLWAQSPEAREPVSVTELSTIPDEFSLLLTPGKIAVLIEGHDPLFLPFDAARSGVGLRLYAAGRALVGSNETRLRLSRISARRVSGEAPTQPLPRPGVTPLPVTPVLRGIPGAEWQRQAPGGLDFAALSQEQADGIRLFREDKPVNNNRIALVSDAPLIQTDRRLLDAGFGVTFQVDPTDPMLAGRLVLSMGPNPFKQAAHEVGLQLIQDGAQSDRLRLTLHTDHFYYDHWQRDLPKGWHRTDWDGSVQMILENGWITIRLGSRQGDPVLMTAQSTKSAPERAFHIALIPGSRHQYDPGGITLRGIGAGWITPAGMDELTRQTLLEAEAFSPDACLSALKIRLDEEIAE